MSLVLNWCKMVASDREVATNRGRGTCSPWARDTRRGKGIFAERGKFSGVICGKFDADFFLRNEEKSAERKYAECHRNEHLLKILAVN